MTENLSNTSNHQRLDEMFIHLTPKGATVPYSLCVDSERNVWVASKGGLFKFDSTGKNLLFERRNPFPKKISPYCQVLYCDGKILYAYAEEQSASTEFRIIDLSGEMLHEQFIDGKVFSISVSAETGDIFMTKQLQGEDSIVYKASMDCPLGWEDVVSEDEYAFQAICLLDSNTLMAATCSIPINMYSKQALRIIDVEKQKVVKTFSKKGKGDGEIFFPRAIQRYENGDALVLDKTGRLQRFTRDGEFVGILAQIDAYLGNGFIVDEGEGEAKGKEEACAVLACSGIMMNRVRETICDDWLEKVKLDGSRWEPHEVDSVA